MRLFVFSIHEFFQPEEIFWPMTDPAGPQRPTSRPRPLSLKAVFWCAVAILLSLGLGHLT
jgi:hypothetical protein